MFRVVLKVRDHSGQCPVQYLENIGPAIEQFDWLILVEVVKSNNVRLKQRFKTITRIKNIPLLTTVN